MTYLGCMAGGAISQGHAAGIVAVAALVTMAIRFSPFVIFKKTYAGDRFVSGRGASLCNYGYAGCILSERCDAAFRQSRDSGACSSSSDSWFT